MTLLGEMSTTTPLITASVLDRYLLLAAGLGILAVSWLLLRSKPRLCVALWIATLSFAPVWLGLNVVAYWPVHALVAAFVLSALLPARNWKTNVGDLMIGLLLLANIIATVIGASTISASFSLVTQWALAFLLARVAASEVDLQWIYGAVAVAFSAVAVLGLIEFVTSDNLFVQVAAGNSAYSLWGELQSRAGVLRVEGAFGHSIALGVSLALAIPLTLASRFPAAVKVLMALGMAGASITTLSRTGMICSAAALLLSIIFGRDHLSTRWRASLLVLLGAGAAAALPYLRTTFDAAGDEASGSAGYRTDMITLIQGIEPIGLSSLFSKSASGEALFGNFQSIDSALLLIGLTYGMIPLLAVIAAVIMGCWLMLRRRATAATIAIVAQIPALLTVALITQYTMFFWFTMGLAFSGQAVLRRAQSTPALSSSRTTRRNLIMSSTTRLPNHSGGGLR